MRRCGLLAIALLLAVVVCSARATCITGELRVFATTSLGKGFVEADGTLLPIAGHDGLYAIYGTRHGGDGVTTFGLPDLRGRAAHGSSSDAGSVGVARGADVAALSAGSLPAHTHGAEANATWPATNVTGGHTSNVHLGIPGPGDWYHLGIPVSPTGLTADAVNGTVSVEGAGPAGASFSVWQPSLAVTYAVCVNGSLDAVPREPGHLILVGAPAASYPPSLNLAPAHGSILNQTDYPELAAALANTWGGNVTTFALPDLSDRLVVGAGGATSETSPRAVGEVGGLESVPIPAAALPSHSHALADVTVRLGVGLNQGIFKTPTGYISNGGGGFSTLAANTQLAPGSLSVWPELAAAGNDSAQVQVAQPSLGLELVLALTPNATNENVASANRTSHHVGEIGFFATATLPSGYLPADGSTVSAATYPELCAVLGTSFGTGPNGTCVLPDLSGRAAVGGAAATPFGSAVGAEAVTLGPEHMPEHTHDLVGTATINTAAGANLNTPSLFAAPGTYFGSNDAFWALVVNNYTQPIAVTEVLAHDTGSSEPVSLMQPFAVVTIGILASNDFVATTTTPTPTTTAVPTTTVAPTTTMAPTTTVAPTTTIGPVEATTTPPSSEDPLETGALSGGALIGIIAGGGVVGVALAAVLVYCLACKSSKGDSGGSVDAGGVA